MPQRAETDHRAQVPEELSAASPEMPVIWISGEGCRIPFGSPGKYS